MKLLLGIMIWIVTIQVNAVSYRSTVLIPQPPHVLAVNECIVEDRRILTVVDTTLTQMTGEVAISTTANDGEPIIIFDKFTVDVLTDNGIEFIFYHECGHHILGHINTPESGRVSHELEENAADCYAVDRYVHKYNKREFVDMLDTLLSVHTNHEERVIQLMECIQ